MEQRNRGAGRITAWVLLALLFGPGAKPSPVQAGGYNPCEKPGNLTVNCGFDTFSGQAHNGKQLQVPTGWSYFILEGDLEYRTSTDTYWDEPSLWLVSDGVPFIAGLYQQVPVTPGVVYQADAGWAAPDKPDFERRLGLDPTGGTNPLASSVIWGRSEWGVGEPQYRWPDLTVSARATGPQMTVFVWVRHPTSHGADSVFIDAVGLWPDPNQPVATITPMPSPVPTRLPATRTPVPFVAAAAPTMPAPTPTVTETAPPPTETPTSLPTATPTETPTPLPPTLTPTPTPTASATPLPVIIAARAEPASAPARSASPARRPKALAGALPYVAGGALLGALLLAAAVAWLLARGRRPDVPPSGEQ